MLTYYEKNNILTEKNSPAKEWWNSFYNLFYFLLQRLFKVLFAFWTFLLMYLCAFAATWRLLRLLVHLASGKTAQLTRSHTHKTHTCTNISSYIIYSYTLCKLLCIFFCATFSLLVETKLQHHRRTSRYCTFVSLNCDYWFRCSIIKMGFRVTCETKYGISGTCSAFKFEKSRRSEGQAKIAHIHTHIKLWTLRCINMSQNM